MANFSKSNVPQFSVDVYQNEYLPEGGREVNAIVTVTSTGGGTAGARRRAAGPPGPERRRGRGDHGRLLRVDGLPADQDAQRARGRRRRPIDTLRDGVAFAVVAGTHWRQKIYPADGSARRRRRADPRAGQAGAAQADARAAAPRSAPGCGWPTGCCRSADRRRSGTRSCSPTAATSTRRRRTCRPRWTPCAGRFTCDARGVGTDWRSRSSQGSPPRCSAPPTSWPTRPAWRPTSAR